MSAAFGWLLPLSTLFIVYGLGNLMGNLPVTPGGLGVVEAVMITALVGFRIPEGDAVLAIVGGRLWQFWLPIAIALPAYLSLRVASRARGASVESRPADHR